MSDSPLGGFDIQVDTREPWEEIAGYLTDLPVSFFVDTLHHKADFHVAAGSGVLGIQRKTCNDFVNSINELKDDLYELREHHDLTALLIEGNYRLAGDSIGLRRGNRVYQAMSAKAWHNFIYSQQLRGTAFLYTTELRETCKVLAWLADYLEDGQSAPINNLTDPEKLLDLLDGIGPVRREAIIEHYGSAGEALANVRDWEEVDGVGPKTREQVVDWLWDDG